MDYLVFNFFSDTKEEAAAKLSAYLSDEQFGAVQEERKRRSNKVVTENGSQRSSTRYSSKKNLQ